MRVNHRYLLARRSINVARPDYVDRVTHRHRSPQRFCTQSAANASSGNLPRKPRYSGFLQSVADAWERGWYSYSKLTAEGSGSAAELAVKFVMVENLQGIKLFFSPWDLLSPTPDAGIRSRYPLDISNTISWTFMPDLELHGFILSSNWMLSSLVERNVPCADHLDMELSCRTLSMCWRRGQ